MPKSTMYQALVFAIAACGAAHGAVHGGQTLRAMQPRVALGMVTRLTDRHFEHSGAVRKGSGFASGFGGLGGTFRALLPVAAGGALLLVGTPALADMAAPVIAGVAEVVVKGPLDSAFFQSLSLIFVSELGDKTFFIATILAARYSRLLTFVGSAGALAVMTVLSVLVGQVFHAVPTGLTKGIPIDDIVAVVSFSYFGIKSLIDASALADGDDSGMAEEQREAESELEAISIKRGRWDIIGEAFALTFAAELGDRSQLTTIALSAAQNPFGVCFGAIIAHCIATGGAVLGGSFISKYLSEKVIGYIGGSLFLVFALTTFVGLAPQLVTLAGF